MARATLRTDSWDTIYTYLQTTNPISTNNIYGSTNSKLVRTAGYPIVIMSPPTTSYEKLTAPGNYTQSEITIHFEIYTETQAAVKSLADEVTAKLLAGRKTFTSSRLMRMQIDDGDYDTWEEGKKKIHMISFDVSFVLVSD